MENKKQFYGIVTALVLIIALMLPAVVQFSHIFNQEHEHVVCKDKTTHVHNAIVKCDICHFQLTSFNYDVVQYPNFKSAIIPSTIEKRFSSLLFNSYKNTNTQLRAPPHNFS